MDLKEDDINRKGLSFRQCNSEPPLGGLLTASSRKSNSSAHSLQDIKSHQQKKLSQKLNMYSGGRNGTVVRSSAFPLLPTLNNKPRGRNIFKCSENAENHKEPGLPFFSNLGYSNHREITPNQKGILQARKYHLRGRYTIDALKAPQIKKPELISSNPLRKRVQEINSVDNKVTKPLPEPDELFSDHCPYSGQQSPIRRLSVITEKSNFSRTSNRTAFFDLEDENEVLRNILPSVEKNHVNKRPNFLEKNSRKLQEHVQMTEKQFNPLETKASLLSNWFKTLETEG